MADVTIDVEVSCIRCSNDLTCKASRSGGRLDCDPCENCLRDERKEGYDEGYDAGHEAQ